MFNEVMFGFLKIADYKQKRLAGARLTCSYRSSRMPPPLQHPDRVDDACRGNNEMLDSVKILCFCADTVVFDPDIVADLIMKPIGETALLFWFLANPPSPVLARKAAQAGNYNR